MFPLRVLHRFEHCLPSANREGPLAEGLLCQLRLDAISAPMRGVTGLHDADSSLSWSNPAAVPIFLDERPIA